MNEKFPVSSVEKAPNSIPSNEELVERMTELTDGAECTEMSKKEDDKGVYLWEMRINDVREDGYYIEYSYQRGGRSGQNPSSPAEIHMMFYDDVGIPRSGPLLYKYTENGWENCFD